MPVLGVGNYSRKISKAHPGALSLELRMSYHIPQEISVAEGLPQEPIGAHPQIDRFCRHFGGFTGDAAYAQEYMRRTTYESAEGPSTKKPARRKL